MANIALVALIVAGAVGLNVFADPYLLSLILKERARRAHRPMDVHGHGGAGLSRTVKLVLEVCVGVGLVLFGLYALLFPQDLYIESVGRLEGIVLSIALAGTGPPLILAGLWESCKPDDTAQKADGRQGRP